MLARADPIQQCTSESWGHGDCATSSGPGHSVCPAQAGPVAGGECLLIFFKLCPAHASFVFHLFLKLMPSHYQLLCCK